MSAKRIGKLGAWELARSHKAALGDGFELRGEGQCPYLHAVIGAGEIVVDGYLAVTRGGSLRVEQWADYDSLLAEVRGVPSDASAVHMVVARLEGGARPPKGCRFVEYATFVAE